MYQRSDSSAKKVHRGRQPRESAGSSYRAVAAGWQRQQRRDLDRVRDCWQTIERGPQGATAFGVWQRRWQRWAAGRGSREDPRTGRIGRSEARRRATSCCKDRHGSSMPRMFSTTYEELKHKGVGLEHGDHGDAGWARCAHQVAGDGCEYGRAWLARAR